MISDCFHKQYSEANESQDEEKVDEKLTPQMMLCPSFQRQIRDVVFTLIPEVPRLRDLFVGWESLTVLDKEIVDDYPKTNKSGMELYKPLIDALRQWDRVQTTQGAPGFDPGMVTLSGHPQIESALSNVVCTLECLVGKLHEENKDNCSKPHDSCNVSTTTSSIRCLYDDEKDRGDSMDVSNDVDVSKKTYSHEDIPDLSETESVPF